MWKGRLNFGHFPGHPNYGKGSLSARGERLFASLILAGLVILMMLTFKRMLR